MPLCGLGSSSSSAAHHDSTNGGAARDRLSKAFISADKSDSAHGHGHNGKPLSRKVVVIGDGACGKSLLNVFVNGEFPHIYEPTVFENHVKEMVIDGIPVELSLWDTAGQEDFDQLRALSYADTHVVLLCFSVDQPISLENIEAKWLDDVLRYCEGVKLCLVALKCDLREEYHRRQSMERQAYQHQQQAPPPPTLTLTGQPPPIEYEQGLAVARRIRASRYLECSAKFDRGVREAFDEAARVAVRSARRGETRGSRPAWEEGKPVRTDGQKPAGGSGKGCVVS